MKSIELIERKRAKVKELDFMIKSQIVAELSDLFYKAAVSALRIGEAVLIFKGPESSMVNFPSSVSVISNGVDGLSGAIIIIIKRMEGFFAGYKSEKLD